MELRWGSYCCVFHLLLQPCCFQNLLLGGFVLQHLIFESENKSAIAHSTVFSACLWIEIECCSSLRPNSLTIITLIWFVLAQSPAGAIVFYMHIKIWPSMSDQAWHKFCLNRWLGLSECTTGCIMHHLIVFICKFIGEDSRSTPEQSCYA